MSKFIAKSIKKLVDDDNRITVMLEVASDSKYAANLTVEEARAVQGNLQVEIKPYKSQRSLEQNRLLWALLGKMANALSGNKRKVSTEECYCAMLEEANVSCDYLLALPEAEAMLKKMFRVVQKIDERVVNGKTLNMYRYYIGSSKFDTKEMTELIEATLDKLAELGIVDSEIELAREEYSR
jgi:hypothetical protein